MLINLENYQFKSPAVSNYKIKIMDQKLIQEDRKSDTAFVKRLHGTAEKPRLSVFRSNSEIYAQLIDDITAKHWLLLLHRDKDIVAQKVTKTEKSKLVGSAIARKATELGITECDF